MTLTIPAFTDEQVAEALRTARPVDPVEVERAQARASAALDTMLASIRQEQPWQR
ncbi:hypothetical protein [Mycobacteroides abscessus]|uniref:hypothetical protein n=1 Tax=Mycobacteroides abscessus TaxID=36809 RepID=UPI001473D7E5